jgi:uncharacterized membrane protein YjjB (DUF3815 family)
VVDDYSPDGTGEIAARLMKMPATTFITTSVIVLVPGFGLYKTMLYLVQGAYSQAGSEGTITILAIGSMALAIALGSLFFRTAKHPPLKKEEHS